MRAQAAARHRRADAAEAARVDVVQREQRQARREGVEARRGRRDDVALEAAAGASRAQLAAPVVEVAGDDHGLARGHFALDEARQLLDLAHPAGGDQPEVGTIDVHRVPFHVHLHVQQAALLEAVVGHVLVADAPIGQRDSSALPCSPWRVIALVW